MKLLIELDITNEKTWSEICGGLIKVVINHHLDKLKKDLKEHCNSELNKKWYLEADSDCNKCVFNINNENDYIEHLKATKPILSSCALNNSQVSISNIADYIHHKNCPHYKPCNKFIETVNCHEIGEFTKKLR